MAPHPTKKPVETKNFFAALSEEPEDPQEQLDASTDGGVSLSREPTPRQELPAFTRAPPGGFGDRLAMARGLQPSDVTPAPPRFAPQVQAAPTAPAAPIAPTGFGSYAGPPTLAAAPGFANPSLGYKPRYGSVPGSYTSPYDVGGKTPGDRRLPASNYDREAWERMWDLGRHQLASETAPHGSDVPPIDSKDKVKAPASTAAERVAPAIPKGAEPRRLWFGPYTMVRHACERQKDIPSAQVLAAWFEQHMPKEHMLVVETDRMLPTIIYAVEIPMTTEFWDRYHQLLTFFPDARDLNEQLDKGYHELDNVTATHTDAAGEATWPQLTEEGASFEEMLTELVVKWNLAAPWDIGRGPGNRPSVWPVEMGGTLRDYPLNK